MGPITFAEALNLLKNGYKMTRVGWNGKSQFVELQVPDEHSKMTLPYIFITTVQGDRVPWLASQTDLLAEDWAIFEESVDNPGDPNCPTPAYHETHRYCPSCSFTNSK